jgi:hypothetical protein
MLAYAIWSLAMAILVGLAGYGLAMIVNILKGFIFDEFKIMIIAWIAFAIWLPPLILRNLVRFSSAAQFFKLRHYQAPNSLGRT